MESAQNMELKNNVEQGATAHDKPCIHTEQPRVALMGNPNCGKTTAFNAYTGARQHVGNYPGVTVDRKEGLVILDGQSITLIDLPGTYSLTAYSPEELVARDVLAPVRAVDRPMAVIDVVDASTLERGLFLTVQVLELGIPLVLACNMMDEARAAGVELNMPLISQRLGVSMAATVARTGEGLDTAMHMALQSADTPKEPLRISYGSDLDPVLEDMEVRLRETGTLAERYPARWIAVKVLEDDTNVIDQLHRKDASLAAELLQMRSAVARHIQETLATTPEALIADGRYGFIRGVLRGAVNKRANTKDRLALTDKLDRVLTHTFAGPLIMLGIMYAMFHLTFEIGAYPQGWVENGFGWLSEVAESVLPDGLLKSLVVSGVIDGVGGVVSFVPLIMIMFLLIAWLEDSGYMARMAYMLDRVFRLFGLHGASVMPYIVSGGIAGGCAIPGVMATRTLRSPKEKLATLLTLPFMACGAKLPVFLLLVGVFFPENQATTMFALTMAGWVAALLVARLLRSTIIRGEATPFVMELPPYRMPSLRGVCIHCWERTWLYLKKAGTVLVAISILLWAAMTFPALDADKAAPFEAKIAQIEEQLVTLPEDAAARETLEADMGALQAQLDGEALRDSYAGRLGSFLEPFTSPLGFDWRMDIALIGGIAAKEAIVSTLGTAYSLGEQDPEDAQGLAERISQDAGWSKATALALMLFVLLYSPCFVALVVIRQEAGSWGWVAFSLLFNTALAYGVAWGAHRIGTALWG